MVGPPHETQKRWNNLSEHTPYPYGEGLGQGHEDIEAEHCLKVGICPTTKESTP